MEKESKTIWEDDFDIMEGMEDLFTKPNTSEEEVDENEEDTNTEDVKVSEEENDLNNNGGADDSDESDEEKDTGEDPDSKDTDGEDNSPSPLTPYAKYLKDEGILPSLNLEEFDGSVESLKEGMIGEIENGINNYIDSLPDRVKKIITNYREGVSLDTILEIDNTRLKYSSITSEQLKNEETQKQILTDYYKKTTQFSDERIAKELKRLDDLQELEDESKYVLQELVGLQDKEEQLAVQKANQDKINAANYKQEQLRILQETINKTEEIIPSIPINKVVKDKLFKNLTTPVAYDNYGNELNKLGAYRVKNPVETELIFHYIFEVTKEFTDWSPLAKSGKKTAIKEFESAIRDLDNKSTNRETKKPVSSRAKDLMSAINEQLDY